MDMQSPFHYDPFSQEARRDPYSFYPGLLQHHPAYFIPEYDTYVISRYADVWDAFMDSSNFSESEGQLFSRDALLVHHRGNPPPPKLDPLDMFNFLDPPIHSRLRQAMAPPFAKSNVAKLGPQITKLVRDRLDILLPRGEFDLNADFGSYVSVGSVCIAMGLELDDAAVIIDAVNQMVARAPDKPGPTAGAGPARNILMSFLKDAVARRRKGEGQESILIDALLRLDVIGRPLTDDEISHDLIAILVGGTETIPKIMCGGLLALSQRPEQLAAVTADLDTTVAPAFEEMLRFNAPAQWFGRTAKNQREVAGVMLEPGQRVILLIAAANRDPREFENPDEFIWNRKARRMLSFGVGPHFCIGIHLARLEGQIMLRELLAAAPRFSLDQKRGAWTVSEFQVGWTQLPMRVA